MADVIVGAYNATADGKRMAGEAFVVYGRCDCDS